MNHNYILHEYDRNLEKILREGMKLDDRTGTGILFLPGLLTTVDISQRVPILTRRKTSWKSMLREYLWFLTGSDNIQDLQNTGSKVWDPWWDDHFTENLGLEPGSIGYGYGPNLINYGGNIKTDQKGFNQLDYVIDLLRNNPRSRRILFTFWRPDKLKEVKLPPCHHTYQFIPEPDEKGKLTKLSCCVYQRSSDYMIGVGSTNLQGAAFYTYMLAQQTNMIPNKLYHFSGHAHIYLNHIPFVEEYLGREIPNSPILNLESQKSIYDYTSEHFKLIDYNPLDRMNIPVAV